MATREQVEVRRYLEGLKRRRSFLLSQLARAKAVVNSLKCTPSISLTASEAAAAIDECKAQVATTKNNLLVIVEMIKKGNII